MRMEIDSFVEERREGVEGAAGDELRLVNTRSVEWLKSLHISPPDTPDGSGELFEV